MDEYISKQAFKEKYLACGWLPEMSEEEFDAFPAADVVEVRHGRWIELDECANEGVYCSVCRKKVYRIDYAWSNNPVKMKSPYCPNCGALMDGKEAGHGS